jgi:pimeloyl-ACP methyl ester carboxylesterase
MGGFVAHGAGHSIWEEQPAKYAPIILDSITGNWP